MAQSQAATENAHPRYHLIGYVTSRDIRTVVERIPEELRVRLRDVHTHSNHRGVHRLGYVTRRGRRDINLCSILPPRVSLRAFVYPGQSAQEFGAPARGQWPPWAVRRFLLYDTLLHELGHLQVVRPEASDPDRKFASETLAQRFADELRRDLYATEFPHPDPIHNVPAPIEQELLTTWATLDKEQREQLTVLVLRAPHTKLPPLRWLDTIPPSQQRFLARVLLHRRSGR